MKHISIEGMDGVGKTTTCNLLAVKLNYKFVQKPLHYLFSEHENEYNEYIRIRDKVNLNPNRTFTAMFYGLGSVYMYELFKDENIVTDRHFASNYAWSGCDDNADVYRLLINKLGPPELTVILYAPKEVLIERLKKRNKNDNDIAKIKESETIYKRMIWFCDEYQLPYMVVDTTLLTPEEVVNKITEKL